MMLNDTAPDLRRRCALQLYDEWHGYYMLRRLIDGQWADVRPLERAEALTYRTAGDEAVELIFCGSAKSNVEAMGERLPYKNFLPETD